MRVFFSAIDPSADQHAAELLKLLKKKHPLVQAVGIGGPALKKEGCQLLWDGPSLAVMGIFPVLRILPRLIKTFYAVLHWIKKNPCDVVIFVDFAGFNLRLAQRVSGYKVYFIPPKVWVWNKKRAKVLANACSMVLCILPFEETFLRALGVHAFYIGNPLIDQMPLLLRAKGKEQLLRQKARAFFGLSNEHCVILMMPGSRLSEIASHQAIFIETLLVVQKKIKAPVVILCPLSKNMHDRLCSSSLDIRFVSDGGEEKYWAMRAADVGLIKSGTSTLEAGLMGLPHVVVYRSTRFLYWILRSFLKYKGPVGLVNLALHQKGPFTEVLAHEVTVQRLSQELCFLLKTPLKKDMAQYIDALQEAFFLKKSPTEHALALILSEKKKGLKP